MVAHLQNGPRLGLVLSGGGARGAYEAGVIHYMRTMLPQELWKYRDFSILCGSSVGAINACFMAATAHNLAYQGANIYEFWKTLKQEDIYRRDILSLAKFASTSFYAVAKNILLRKIDKPEKNYKKDHFKGLLNTAPFAPFLQKIIPWKQISVNIKNRALMAASVTTTNIVTGKMELFVEKHPDLPYTGHYIFHDTKLEFQHAMASAAIPLIFPTVKVGRCHYLDGGLRLNTPLSPAIQLGAEKILVIGPHHQEEGFDHVKSCDVSNGENPPSLGMILGKILSSIFIDKLDYDIEQMNRINRLIDWGRGCYGEDFVERINHYLQDNQIKGDIANRGLKKLSVMEVFPSEDIRDIFFQAVSRSGNFNAGLTSFEKILLKVLDVDLETGKDFLSFIMFDPEYIKCLIDLGFEDARKRHDQLVEFFATD